MFARSPRPDRTWGMVATTLIDILLEYSHIFQSPQIREEVGWNAFQRIVVKFTVGCDDKRNRVVFQIELWEHRPAGT